MERRRILQLLQWMIIAALSLMGVYVVVILFTGIDKFEFHGVTYQRLSLAFLMIICLLLVIALLITRKIIYKTQVSLGLILFCVLSILYLSNNNLPDAPDAVGLRYVPLSILRQGNFDLDEFSFLYKTFMPHFLTLENGRVLSAYPVGAPILAIPFYFITSIGPADAQNPLIKELEKLSAAFIVALSAVVLYCTLNLVTDRKRSLIITLIYAVATTNLSVTSQALLQHGPSELAIICTLYCIVKGQKSPSWISIAGIPAGFSIICRPTDVLIIAPLAVYILVQHPRRFLTFCVGALPSALFQLWYNQHYFDDPFHTQFPIFTSWTTPFFEGFIGILFSPSKGLFIYSPILILSFAGMVVAWRKSDYTLLRYLSVGCLLTILMYSKWKAWHGGASYGPRYLSDLNPILSLALYPLNLAHLKNKYIKIVLLCALVWSIYIHCLGAFFKADAEPWRRYAEEQKRISFQELGTNSRSSPEQVLAAYKTNLHRKFKVTALSPIDVSVTVTNTGKASWLPWSKDGTGVVYLQWQWYLDESIVPGLSGQAPLEDYVRPKESYSFDLNIHTPFRPGIYLLQLFMVNQEKTTSTVIGKEQSFIITVEADREDILWIWKDAPFIYYSKVMLDHLSGN
jgi:uncharacterized membrane protein YGL010W